MLLSPVLFLVPLALLGAPPGGWQEVLGGLQDRAQPAAGPAPQLVSPSRAMTRIPGSLPPSLKGQRQSPAPRKTPIPSSSAPQSTSRRLPPWALPAGSNFTAQLSLPGLAPWDSPWSLPAARPPPSLAPWWPAPPTARPGECETSSDLMVTYFQSPGFPSSPPSAPTDCPLDIQLRPGVCQIRLDLLTVELPGLEGGDCTDQGRISLSSTVPEAFLPVGEICGQHGQAPGDPGRPDVPHLYIHLGDARTGRPRQSSTRTVSLRAQVSDMSSRWNVRVTQIQCNGNRLQAPPGCAQYHTQNSGNISSLNWRDGTYPRNLHLASCIRPDFSACAIQYKVERLGLGRFSGGGLGYGLACRDFLTFHGEKTGICGSVTSPREVTLPSSSLLGLTMDSDSSHRPEEGGGFHLSYRFLHDCRGLQYFQYPRPSLK